MGSSEQVVLVAYDGSTAADEAIQTAARLFPGAQAVVMHVEQGPDTRPSSATKSARIAHAGVLLAERAGLRAEPHTAAVTGPSDTCTAILDTAADREASLIVMGARGRSGLTSLLLGSVSHGVVQRADRPVLVVKGPSFALTEDLNSF